MTLCPCGSFLPEQMCCRPLVNGLKQARTAEQLMRSRYCAFFWGDSSYLSRTQNYPFDKGAEQLLTIEWVGLQILSIVDGRSHHSHGIVEFEATYIQGGMRHEMTERSAFRKRGDVWVYIGSESN